MTRLFGIIFCTILIYISTCLPTLARQSLPVDTGKVTASLISSHDSVAPGQSFYVALRTDLDEGWHTYWRNPGDSGEPVQINWILPSNMSAGDIHWPLPKPIPTGPIVNYGFEGTPLFPVEFIAPANAKTGDILTLKSEFYYLVCKDVCIPENGTAQILIEIGDTVTDDEWREPIEKALELSPRKAGVNGAIDNANNRIQMTFTDLPKGDVSKSYFFPYPQGVLQHSQPQEVQIGADGLRLETAPDYLWDEGDIPKNISGILTYTDNGIYRGVEVDLTVNSTVDIGAISSSKASPSIGDITVWSALIGAFLGGIILNIMPCVFPILSLKALSLAKTAHNDRSANRKSAWAYTIGVLTTFILIAIILVIIKSTGAQIGWGFQLQSPKIVGWLAILLFVIGLNLLGVFEFGAGLQNTGASLTKKDGFAGSFFTGALAVIVATPCTAPFMATAIGYALAQPALIMFIVFIALGFGFALPFLILGYMPALLTILPKPGPWMVRFKECLAFPMFAAAIWLVWVLSFQAGANGVAIILTSTMFMAFAIWLFKAHAKWTKILAGLAICIALSLPVTLSPSAATPSLDPVTAQTDTQIWSQEAVAQNLAQGRSVFVDFTAAWCVTCKVNERLVLNTKAVQTLFSETQTTILIADWTNKNDVIASELQRYGRAGVPLYLVFTPKTGAEKGIVLPQTLSYDVIKEALEN